VVHSLETKESFADLLFWRTVSHSLWQIHWQLMKGFPLAPLALDVSLLVGYYCNIELNIEVI